MPLNFIYFTWPSEGPFSLVPNNPFSTAIPCLDFGVLGRRAELNGFYLADLIGSLPGPTTVSLIGHSLGARTIATGLHLLGGGTVHGKARWNPADCGHRIRVVLAAAAIEHDWLNPGDRYGCAQPSRMSAQLAQRMRLRSGSVPTETAVLEPHWRGRDSRTKTNASWASGSCKFPS